MPPCQSPWFPHSRRVPAITIATAIVFVHLGALHDAAGDPGEVELSVMTILLPTWTDSPQQLEIEDLEGDDSPLPPEEVATEAPSAPPAAGPPAGSPLVEVDAPTVRALAAATDTTPPEATTTAHLLIPQGAPPIPSRVRFHLSSPAGDIWFQGLTWVVKAEECETSERFPAAIAHYQNARSAYQQVAERYPEWQPDIVAFRLQDLERRIRRLVRTTRSEHDDDQSPASPSATG